MISPRQLRTLQTLYGMYAEHAADLGEGRAARLAWAAQQLGRQVASFSELRGDEAAQLIDTLKRALGQAGKPAWPRVRDYEAARAAGTHGRRGRAVKVEMLATAADLARVEELRERLGMSREEFGAWLRSRSSPLGQRANAALRTVSDCNRVLWALKAMLKRGATFVGSGKAEPATVRAVASP
ncbi:MAG: hypothetical protein ACRD5G_15740 [Candidatus Acidiferrales bacterium]